MLERLLKDITGAWKTRGTDAGLVVKVTDRDLTLGDTTSASPTVVSGPLAAVVEWAAGRGNGGVTAAGPGSDRTVRFRPHRSGSEPRLTRSIKRRGPR